MVNKYREMQCFKVQKSDLYLQKLTPANMEKFLSRSFSGQSCGSLCKEAED